MKRVLKILVIQSLNVISVLIDSVLVICVNVYQAMINKINLKTRVIHKFAVFVAIVIKKIETEFVFTIYVNAVLIMHSILKPEFVIKFLKSADYGINQFCIKKILVNVNQVLNAVNLKTRVIQNFVVLTAIVIHSIRILPVLEKNANVSLDKLCIQTIGSVK